MDYYEIIIKGYLDEKRFLMFEEMKIELIANGRTKLSGVLDQSALYAVIKYIKNLGLKLISVNKCD